jgi:hypothetical protein
MRLTRYALLLSPLVIVALLHGVASCGGSASETPWPVEPEAQQFAPPGESATAASITEVPDAGRARR